tara:strand:+ start:214 stop:756 length:543 start_codon:yes stop_codon:yes gene_type:complete
MVPKYAFIVSGCGKAKEKLASFEMALRDAGIAEYNLVKVSSILPPNCKIINKKKGISMLSPGQIVFVVMSEQSTNEPGRQITASVGIAIPPDRSKHGYLSEHHSYGQTKKESGIYSKNLAAYMLATIMDGSVNAERNYNQQKDLWKIKGKPIQTKEVTSYSCGDQNGNWVTVLSAVVLII